MASKKLSYQLEMLRLVKNRQNCYFVAARDHLRLRREHKTFMRKSTRAIARGVIKGLRDARKGR